ncbi:ABC transporter ATP-binding protein [Peptoniphilus mikwangii]|uniref:ABC transporter ATP-binding protein n=1 Tax=Peptoniphilus mikwangii TaxID=1354300 RepID=UPI00040C968B|nr:ABC transporter ATP-binding protein [Peptoniphilus mikwangii]
MNTYKKLLSYVPEKKHDAYISMILSVISCFLLMGPYWYFWKFLNELIVNGNVENSKYYAVLIVVMMIANSIVYFFALWASHLLAFRLETNLRKVGIKYLMNSSFAFFDMNSSGKIRKIIDDNAAETHMIVAHLIPDLVGAVITPILMVMITFMVDIKFGIAIIILIFIGGIEVNWMMGNKEFMATYMASLEKLNSEAVEYVRGMQVVKIFRSTIHSFKAFYESIMSYSKYAFNYTISCRTPYVAFQVLFNIFAVISIPFAIYFLNRGVNPKFILAKTVFFMCFAGIMFTCFMKIMYVGMYQYMGVSAVEKLEKLFEGMSVENLKHGNIEKFDSYNIEFKNVSFKYEDDYVLKNVSFSLKDKRVYALVGSSGSGKSTIAKLISGFYKVDEGTILIGERNISEYSQKALMSNIAFVFQNSKLFKTTIFENVKMGNENASYEDVMNALKSARCDDILDKFKDRENTVIGSKGVHLSGGEIQRIAIARAILKNANIIILDEASAAADPENEYEIQQAFSNLMKDKTVIMIAHRLSSIRNVDEILVIEDGNVIERGTDKELMNIEGKYSALQALFAKANDWRIYD